MQVHHVSLTVTDLDRSVAWYRELFDLEPAMDEDGGDRRAAVLRFRDTGALFGLVQHGGGGAGFDPRVTGLDHVAWTVDHRAALDDWVARLDARSITHSGVVDIPVGAILNFRDPDGIQLALFWDRP